MTDLKSYLLSVNEKYAENFKDGNLPIPPAKKNSSIIMYGC
jgi:hypothetical protein